MSTQFKAEAMVGVVVNFNVYDETGLRQEAVEAFVTNGFPDINDVHAWLEELTDCDYDLNSIECIHHGGRARLL
jgi:hypothetical protein